MAGRFCGRKERHFLRNHQSSQPHERPRSCHHASTASVKEEEHWHEGARLRGLVGERMVKRIRRPASRRVGARQNLDWSPASFRDGRPQVLGLAPLRVVPIRLSSLEEGMLQCRMAQATVVCVAIAVR